MADYLTHGFTFSEESKTDYFIDPLFVNSPIRKILKIITDVKHSRKLDFIHRVEKIMKTYAQGTSFTSSSGATVTQKTLLVADMKGEIKQNGKAFLQWVKEWALNKGYKENDITGTLFEQILASLFAESIAADLSRQPFLNDTVKETLVYTGGLPSPSGTADDDYNDYPGLWPRMIRNLAGTSIAAGQKVDLNTTTYQTTVAVKGKKTLTLTGTSGTANVVINGRTYLATFATSLTVTATNFQAANAATILALDHQCVVTNSGVTVIVESGVPGGNVLVSITNVSGDLAGSVATTTAAVLNTTLKTDAAKLAFQAMYEAMPNVLRAVKKTGKLRFLVTASMEDNYIATLETLNGSEAGFYTLVDGVKTLSYRGIPIITREEWDEHIEEDFGLIRPHRAILTWPEENLVFGTDGETDDALMEFFYDQVTQNNVMRVEMKCGTHVIHDELVVLGY